MPGRVVANDRVLVGQQLSMLATAVWGHGCSPKKRSSAEGTSNFVLLLCIRRQAAGHLVSVGGMMQTRQVQIPNEIPHDMRRAFLAFIEEHVQRNLVAIWYRVNKRCEPPEEWLNAHEWAKDRA